MKNLFLFTAAFLFGHLFLSAQTVTTFTEGTPDDAIVLDNDGNIYCSNYVGDTVFKFSPTGEATAFITGLNTPNGLAFNSNQELYVCDGQGDKIYKYDLAGNLLATYPVSGHPSGIVKSFDDDSMIFTLYLGNLIKKIAPDGTITTVSSSTELSGPVGIVYDENGNLFVGNYTDRKIFKIEENGDLEYVAQLPSEGGPYPNLGFISYGQGKLWGTIMGNHKIYSINPNAVDDYTLFAGSIRGNNDGDISVATFNIPNGIYFDEGAGTMYITDFGSKNLRIISGITLGNDEFSEAENHLIIAPNPAKNYVEIQFSGKQFATFELKVYDATGKLVYENKHQEIFHKIDTSSWTNGLYLLEITTEESTLRKRLLK